MSVIVNKHLGGYRVAGDADSTGIVANALLVCGHFVYDVGGNELPVPPEAAVAIRVLHEHLGELRAAALTEPAITFR
jgi:hypothetical protein